MNRKSKIALVAGGVFLLLGVLLWTAYFGITRTFYNVNILTILLYLNAPLTGVEKRYLFDGGLLALAAVFGFALVMLWMKRYVVRAGARGAFLFLIASVVVLASALFAIDKQFQITEFLIVPERYSTYIDENYSMFSPEEMTFENGRNNLIVVILESMESGFTDGALFSPPIMPLCAALEKEAIVFRGHREVIGTNYSVAGFTSMMLGIPAAYPMGLREVAENILEGAKPDVPTSERDWSDYSVPGLLEQKGYDISFFTGADARFSDFEARARAMTKKIEVRDLIHFQKKYGEVPEMRNGWGLNDSFLYARVKEYLAENHGEKPFCMLIQTVDTHIPGYYEPGMERPFGDPRDSFFQTDQMLLDLLGWIREQPFGENTTVVFVGDHIYPGDALGPVKLPRDRGIMCSIFNARGRSEPEETRRMFATFDVAPTLLEAAGATFPERKLGLGVSLFSSQRTLLEKDGVKKFNKENLSRSKANEERYGW